MEKHIKSLLVFLALVALVVVGREVSILPNFTPVMAVGLFSAFFFRSKLMAFATPLLGMLITDLFFEGTYTLGTMVFVYAGLALPALLGFWIAQKHRGVAGKGVAMGGKLLISAFAASTFFFFLSNLGVWLFDGMYATTAGGFVACYASALPFYKFSLLGDLTFTFVLFGVYGLANAWNRSAALNSSSAQA